MTKRLAINLQKVIFNALEGQQSAYTELLNTFWNDIYLFLSKKCRYEHEAEDLTIKVFSRAFDKLNLYKPEYSFRNWLLAIANNMYIDFMRSQQKSFETLNINKEDFNSIPDETETAEDLLIREQQLDKLLKFVNTLKPHYRKVIQLKYFQEYTINEIALELGESNSNVKVKLLRARRLLSEKINKNH